MSERWYPYSPEQQSGHSGDSSKDAEPKRRERIEEAYMCVARSGLRGTTWREYSRAAGIHHGMASGALSNLHRTGMITRLREKRGGCGIYVTIGNVDDRPTIPHRSNLSVSKKERILDRLLSVDDGHNTAAVAQAIQIIQEEL